LRVVVASETLSITAVSAAGIGTHPRRELSTMDDRMLYSYDEAMHKLGIGRTTLYGLIDTGQLVKVNIGRRGLITAESLVAYVDSLKDATT
jgi:excisionase family DNA binding protein